MTVGNKSMLQIKNGREKIGVNFTGLTEIIQNEEGLIFFNKKEPIYFELLEYAFDGAIYNTVVESKQNGLSVTKEKSSIKEDCWRSYFRNNVISRYRYISRCICRRKK